MSTTTPTTKFEFPTCSTSREDNLRKVICAPIISSRHVTQLEMIMLTNSERHEEPIIFSRCHSGVILDLDFDAGDTDCEVANPMGSFSDEFWDMTAEFQRRGYRYLCLHRHGDVLPGLPVYEHIYR